MMSQFDLLKLLSVLQILELFLVGIFEINFSDEGLALNMLCLFCSKDVAISESNEDPRT